MEIILTIAKWVTAIGGIGGFLIGLYKLIRSIEKIKEQQDSRFDEIYNKLVDVDASSCKNFLVRFLKDVEQGAEVDEVEEERAHEVYEHYIKDLKKNSYIHSKWDKTMK